jgi:GNAT superfamily N-acetyltransferase
MSISTVENFTPTQSDIEQIAIPLRRYNFQLIGSYRTQDLLVSLYDGNVFIGGGYALIKLGWLHIELLWIEPKVRKLGYGALLLSKLENIAINKFHIRSFKLNTGDFQKSRKFYEHFGYAVFSKLEIYPENGNKNKKYVDYYMKKNI